MKNLSNLKFIKMDPSLKRSLYKFSRPVVRSVNHVNEFSGILTSILTRERYQEIREEITRYIMTTSYYNPGFDFSFIDECSDVDSFTEIKIVVSINRTISPSLKLNSFRNFLYNTECFRNIKPENESISCMFKSFSDIVKVVFIKTNSIQSGYLYYSFSFSPLLERLSDYLGLSISKNGLYLNVNGELLKQIGLKQSVHPKSIYSRILLSDELHKIFEYLGINLKRYRSGFESYSDVLDLIKESSYYNESIFSEGSTEKLLPIEMITFHMFLLDDLGVNINLDELLKRIKNANKTGNKLLPLIKIDDVEN